MIDYIGKRKYFFAISFIIILAGIIGLFVNGLQLDIQFQGGTIIQLEMDNDNYDIGELEAKISKIAGKAVSAQKLETYNPENTEERLKILMLKLGGVTLSETERADILQMIMEEYPVADNPEMQVDSVEPFIGKEMLKNGITAALIASALIIIYIWYRFSVMSGLAAAITAVKALL